jgi:hypothetical protein
MGHISLWLGDNIDIINKNADNIDTINKKTETLIDACKQVGLEIT